MAGDSDRADALQALANAVTQLRHATPPAARALAIRATQHALQALDASPPDPNEPE
jgi:hypothetical protein